MKIVSTSSVSVLIRGLLIVSAAATAVPAFAKDEGREDISKFMANAQCKLSESEQGRMPNLSGRSHFRGSMKGSSYGDVFFAGGAGNRVKGSSKDEKSDKGGRASSPAATLGAGGEGNAGGAGSASGTGAGSGSGATAGTGASAGQGPGTAGPIGSGPEAWSGAGTTASASGPVPSPNPEPASLLLIGTGLGGFLVLRRRGRQTKS